jgi:hypothetical protein
MLVEEQFDLFFVGGALGGGGEGDFVAVGVVARLGDDGDAGAGAGEGGGEGVVEDAEGGEVDGGEGVGGGVGEAGVALGGVG